MYPPQPDTFMNRITKALCLPIRARCAELTVLFDRGSIMELQMVFPLLIDSIFGPHGSISWGLRVLQCVNEEFRQLEHFLSPCGPFFKLIYTLLKDPSAKYDFPVDLLPAKLQSMDHFNLHPFYADLVNANVQTKQIISLRLNPFDYYMFHFAYHLVNPWHQRSGAVGLTPVTWNTVYYVLCCDYMLHFLPTNPDCKVMPVILYNGKNPMSVLPQVEKSPVGSVLINKNILSKSLDEYTQNQNFLRHPRTFTWRSETVLNVFVDMWLSNDSINQNNQMNSSLNTPQFARLQYSELPTAEYMRIVRVLIKQIHSFSASAKIDDTDLCELKKISLKIVEGKFYAFIRNLVHKWPLDGSFRLLLELWLTYIQPWRYPPDNSSKKGFNEADDDDKTPSPTREHMQFIAENLLLYVVIFQQLLPRFTRVDLVSPKMSVMLFRISKVFNQTNLPVFLREIENSIDYSNNSQSRSFSHMSHLPPLSPTTNWCSNLAENSGFFNSTPTHSSTTLADRKWNAIVKQKIYELEGPMFNYRPLFVAPPAGEVYDLLKHIKRSIKVAEEIVLMKQQEEDEIYSSFFGIFSSLWKAPKTTDEFTLNERLKVPEYLNRALDNLVGLFGITHLPEIDTSEPGNQSQPSSSFDPRTDFRFLTPSVVRERMKRLRYEGDPDLHPIRSNEITFLVRMLYDISRQINETFSEKINEFYYDQSFWGRFSRQILAPPMTVYKYDTSAPGSPRIGQNLPPRVSLRYFATYQFLIYFLLFGGIFYLFGFSVLSYVFAALFVWFFYTSMKAVVSSPVRHNYPTEGFRNISFDDSF